MPTVNQRLRTVLSKNVQMTDEGKVDPKKQNGGLAVLDAENGVMEKTTTIKIGLPRPQGCSQSFIEGESWQDFEDKFKMYALATDLDRDNGDVQMMMLLMCLDGEAV